MFQGHTPEKGREAARCRTVATANCSPCSSAARAAAERKKKTATRSGRAGRILQSPPTDYESRWLVVNIGLSPTFEGQENPEKIAEAHLIGDCGFESDFYGEVSFKRTVHMTPVVVVVTCRSIKRQVMRLSLVGAQRSEMKFDSFPALVAQITKDVADANEVLDRSPFNTIRFFGGFELSCCRSELMDHKHFSPLTRHDPWLKRKALGSGAFDEKGVVPEW